VRALLSRLLGKPRLPGLALTADALCELGGTLAYGEGCAIGSRAVLVVPPDTELRLGDRVYVGRYVELGPGRRIHIGDDTSIQDRCIFVGDVSIGAYCIFSLNVLITSGHHFYDRHPELLIRDQDREARATPEMTAALSRPVRIGEDCWIGANTVILSGVSIGKGCVIGANSVVNRDIPPYSVAVGAPARVVKKRLDFSPPTLLNALREADLPYFYSGFGLSADERQRGRALGGLLAGRQFSLTAAATAGRRIRLSARHVEQPCSLSLNGRSIPLAAEYCDVTFDLPPGAEPPYVFTADGPGSSKRPICVRSAECF
jgi:acetyltransferase-like isoleucine patch superfamily enzyme